MQHSGVSVGFIRVVPLLCRRIAHPRLIALLVASIMFTDITPF